MIVKNEFFSMLIEKAALASTRARWTMTVATVISITQLAAVYNFAFSTLRPLVEKLLFQDVNIDHTKFATELQSAMIKSWAEHLTVSVNLFGVKFSAGDSATIGAFALLLASVWHYFSIRRENHLIASTLQMAKNEEPAMQTYVFHGLASSQIFATLTDDDSPADHSNHSAKRAVVPHIVAGIMLYLPALAVGLMLLIDLYSVFGLSAVFRNSVHTPWELYRKAAPSDRWLDDAMVMFAVKFVLELIFFILLTHICRSMQLLQKSTQSLLRDNKRWGDFVPQ
jgi:hypothetical protein